MFKTKYSNMYAYEERDRYRANPGSKYAPVYSLASKEAGKIDLEVTGEKNIYDEIQSHAQSVDIHNILLKYKMGDESVLQKKKGMFIDVTDMPTNFADIMKTVITAENNFNELPFDVRKEYNFSPAEYIADIGSERWLTALGITKEEAKAIGEEDKKEGESNE